MLVKNYFFPKLPSRFLTVSLKLNKNFFCFQPSLSWILVLARNVHYGAWLSFRCILGDEFIAGFLHIHYKGGFFFLWAIGRFCDLNYVVDSVLFFIRHYKSDVSVTMNAKYSKHKCSASPVLSWAGQTTLLSLWDAFLWGCTSLSVARIS